MKIMGEWEQLALKLFKHNEDAYRASVKMLNEKGKAAVIHSTGTGKSFIAFKLCDDNMDKTICWISPSEYIFKTQLENIKAVSEDFNPDNIKFYTYARLMNMTEDEISEVRPDYIVLDEFHRCGARLWGTGVETLLDKFSEVPVLGLSATSIRYLDNQRDMADEIFDGNVASQMTLGEAIVLGILNSPEYILSVFSYRENYRNLLWERYYSAAEQYYKKHGSLKLSFDYVTEDGIKLGGWVQRMRAAKCEGRYGGIDSVKVSRLEKIGMIWNVVDSRWEENYLEAVKYFRKYGNLNVPGKYVTESGIKLGNWIVHLRQKKNGNGNGRPLDEEQTERLNRIGMIWDVEQHRFDVGLEHAERYFSEHGNLKVSPKYVCDDGYALGAWIVQKKRQYRTGTMSEDRIQKLEKTGIIWPSKGAGQDD